VTSVFINQNLTKAEAAAAYQLRVQRRRAMLRRQQSKTGDNCFVNHKSLQDHGSSAIDNLLQSNNAVAVNTVALNPSADVFNPVNPSAVDSTD
jgi:hypothetical protein